jgi:hypothetical protein
VPILRRVAHPPKTKPPLVSDLPSGIILTKAPPIVETTHTRQRRTCHPPSQPQSIISSNSGEFEATRTSTHSVPSTIVRPTGFAALGNRDFKKETSSPCPSVSEALTFTYSVIRPFSVLTLPGLIIVCKQRSQSGYAVRSIFPRRRNIRSTHAGASSPPKNPR